MAKFEVQLNKEEDRVKYIYPFHPSIGHSTSISQTPEIFWVRFGTR